MICPNQQCEQFGAELGAKKFCNKCGTPTAAGNAAPPPQSTFATKNFVTGDQRITNTTVVNQDETTAVSQCAISGRQAQRIEGYICPSCGKWVHSDFYDPLHRRCVRCRDQQSEESQQGFRNAAVEVFADGIATKEETEQLRQLAAQLGISSEKQREIISEVRSQRSASKPMSAVDRAKLKTALAGLRDLRVDSKGAFANRNQALATLRALHANYPSDERIATLFVLGSAVQFLSLSGMEMIQHLVQQAQEDGKLPSSVPDDIELDRRQLDAAQQSAAQCFSDARDIIRSSEAFKHDSALSAVTSKCTTCGHFKVHHLGRSVFSLFSALIASCGWLFVGEAVLRSRRLQLFPLEEGCGEPWFPALSVPAVRPLLWFEIMAGFVRGRHVLLGRFAGGGNCGR
jgi:hypothetical protein